MVSGLQHIMIAEVEMLSKQLHHIADKYAQKPAVQIAFGLFFCGAGVYLLLNKGFSSPFSDSWLPLIIMLVWMACCALFSWRFYRWRNRRVAHP
jgi:Kef-type K+ transport system membrane component KefB